MKIASSSLLLLVATAAVSCKGANADVKLSKGTVEADADPGTFTHMEVSVGNPRIAPKTAGVSVFVRPSKSAPKIGTLAVGRSVPRSDKIVRKTDQCEAGYYAVNPRGFVCADDTSETGASAAGAADTERALPYRYGILRTVSPLYARAPSPEEQAANEPDLSKHLAKLAKVDTKTLGAGANDVPTDEAGIAKSVAVMNKNSFGIDERGKRTTASIWNGLSNDVPVAPADRASAPPVARTLRKGSGLAIVAITELPGPSGARRFGVTPDANFIPLDRVDAAIGSTWHGVDLTKDKALPLGFVLRHEVAPYAMAKGKAERQDDDEVDRRSHVYLTGRFRTIDQVQYEEAEDGLWYRHRDLIKVVKRSKFPDFVTDGEKWVDVSLALQTLTLYEGRKPIYTTLASTGRDVLGPKDVPATPEMATTMQGTFKVTMKANTMTLDPRETNDAFEINDAPYALEFAPGYSIVGAYHSDTSGEAKQFHNVALTPIDARRVFLWAGPAVPDGFANIVPTETETITVHVRK